MQTKPGSGLRDEELVRRYPTDPAALDELIARYEDRVMRCARRMSLNRDEAEDLVQETFLRVLLSMPKFHGASSFGTWLYAIAHNTCVDAARRHLRAPGMEDLDTLVESRWEPAGSHSVEEEVEDQINQCFVGRAIAALTHRLRDGGAAAARRRSLERGHRRASRNLGRVGEGQAAACPQDPARSAEPALRMPSVPRAGQVPGRAPGPSDAR